jgi:hypothetical protein
MNNTSFLSPASYERMTAAASAMFYRAEELLPVWHICQMARSTRSLDVYVSTLPLMLISKTHYDLPTKQGTKIRIFVIAPNIPDYPQAKFPGPISYSSFIHF